MKINMLARRCRCLTIFLVILAIGAAVPGFCAEPKKVAVLPFTMNAPQDLSFLQNGLYSMLYSRLTDPGKVQVLEREAIDAALKAMRSDGRIGETLHPSQARAVGDYLGVDYVLFGSLTQFGQGVSLDAGLVDRKEDKPVLTFFDQSDRLEDAITLVHRFAEDVNLKVFDRDIQPKRYAAPEQPVYADEAYRAQARETRFETHLEFPGVITALGAGDLNRDGRMRMVAATDHDLMIYRMEGRQLVQETVLNFSSALRFVGLDVADINRNGFPEIFVTSLTIHRDGLSSFVLEFDGAGYKTLTDSEPYYYRVSNIPGRSEPVLLAQKSAGHPFKGDITTMKADNRSYIPDQKLSLPRNVSVLSLAQGPVTAEGGNECVLINGNGRLAVVDEVGKIRWEGTQRYGGTDHHFLLPRADTDASFQERVYLPSRIQFLPSGESGPPEVLTVQNKELGGGALGMYKRFTGGNLEFHSWNGIALSPVFQARPVETWISDFVVADMDGSGRPRIWTSVVGKLNLSLSDAGRTSNVISYSLPDKKP